MIARAGDNPAGTASTGTLFILAAALGFSAVSALASVAIAEGTSVANVLAWRYTLASVVLTVIAGVRGFPKRMPTRDLYAWLAIGGGGQALFVGLALSSIAYIPVATLAFLFYTYPAWVTLVQAARGAERLTARRGAALALSFGGIAVMVGVPGTFGADSGDASWKGVALALGAAMIYGVYIPVARRMQKDFALPVTSALSRIGAAGCLLLWAIADNSFEFALSGRAWGAIAALTILGTVLPSLVFPMGQARLGPVRAATVSTAEPFLTAVIGALVLGQGITARTALGGAMISGAVMLLQFRRERVA